MSEKEKNRDVDIVDVRNELFECMKRMRDGKLDVNTAREINEMARTMVLSAKVEVDFLKATEQIQSTTGFIPSPNDLTPEGNETPQQQIENSEDE